MKKILFFCVLFFLFPSEAFAVSANNVITGSTTNTNTVTTALVSLTANNLELLRVESRTGNSTEPNQPSVSGDNLTWTAVDSSYFDTDGTSRKKLTVFKAQGTPILGTVIINFSGQTQTDVTYSLDEFSGVATNPVVQSAKANDTDGGNLSISLATFASSSNTTYGAFSSDVGTGTMTVGSGFTKIGGIDTSTIQAGSEWKNTADTGVDASFNSISGGRTGGIALEIAENSSPTPTPTPGANLNRPDHTVIVVEENRKLQDVLRVDYFTFLATQGALMVNSKGLYHPSQPDYFALFSGSNQGITDDTCPPFGSPFSTNNLGNQLFTNLFTFTGFAENMPSNPRTNCTNTNGWDNNHAPWIHFSNLPSSSSAVFTSFPTNYANLPTVSFVIPNINHNAHDGTILDASNWLEDNIEPYRQWAMAHNSLLIVTFDEDDEGADNTIYTLFAGQKIKKGIYNEAITHYNVLSTVEDLYDLPALTSADSISDIWN